jgi:membrane protease YdiL (CAAX protease family)
MVLWLVGYELLAFTAVFWIARIRGWSFATFGLHISWKWTGVGILLFVVVVLTTIFQTVLFQVIHPAKIATPLTGALTLPFVILTSLINPFFEELMEVGYFVHALKRYGMWPAVLASAFFRTFLHAYAGLNFAATCLSLGLMFGVAYWRWRQLWPLFVAHATMDFYALHSLIQSA